MHTISSRNKGNKMKEYSKNLKNLMIVIALITLIALCIVFTSGCEKKSKEGYDGNKSIPCNLAIVYSNRQNSSAGINEKLLGDYIMGSLENDPKGEVSKNNQLFIVTADGKPSKDSTTFERSEKNNRDNIIKENKDNTNKVLNYLKGVNAKNEESDIVSAITKANNNFTCKNDQENIIFVIDSGISTSGSVINLANPSTYGMNPEDVSNLNIPNLKKTDKIIWTGFNSVADSQEEIPSNLQPRIENLYKEVLKKGLKNPSAENCFEFLEGSSNNSYRPTKNELPKVSQINYPDTQVKYDFLYDKNKSLILTDTVLQFQPDSTEYNNPEDANQVISSLATELKSDNKIKISIDGYIASNHKEEGNLSQQRAEKVKQSLINYQIPENRISASGKGPGPYPYYDENNNINASNRYIEIKRID